LERVPPGALSISCRFTFVVVVVVSVCAGAAETVTVSRCAATGSSMWKIGAVPERTVVACSTVAKPTLDTAME
jgi:hypothetical protein